jgi:tetratricopeptide (TPR) repeat protein
LANQGIKYFCFLAVSFLTLGLAESAVWSESTLDSSAYFKAAQVFNQKNQEKARVFFLEFQKQFPASRWRWAVALRLADLESNSRTAENQYRKICLQASDEEWKSDASWSFANSLYAAGRYSEARSIFHQLTQTANPWKLHSFQREAQCLLALQDPESACRNYQALLGLNPDPLLTSTVLFEWGETESARGNSINAQSAFLEYLKKFPNGEQALWIREKLKNVSSTEKVRISPAGTSLNTNAIEPETVQEKSADFVPGKSFCVQVGAFSKPEYAQALILKLKNKGYSAVLFDAISNDGVFHQVRIGNYARRDFAEKIARQLSEKEGLPTLILSATESSAQAVGKRKDIRNKP